MTRADVIGKRLLGIDFGLKRVGLAVADELAITVTPRLTLDKNSPNFWSNILAFIKSERIGLCVLGLPIRNDEEKSEVYLAIEEFADKLKELSAVEVVFHDESYSSINAASTMISIGKKKKVRSMKGEKDKIAAALILKDFLEQFE